MQESKNLLFQEVLSRIETANDFEINEIISAVMRRYRTAFPDWEVLYIACPKNDPAQRQQTMEFIIDHFQRHT